MSLLATRNITVHFGGITALDDVVVSIHKGEIVGLLGPNGAGKTTLFQAIGGFLQPDSGSVLLDGREIQHLLPYERVAAGIGRSFQQVRLFPTLTVYEVLLVAQHRQLSSGPFAAMFRSRASRRDEKLARERVDAILELIDLSPWLDAYSTELSHGTARLVELAAVLSLNPRVVLLDEPSSGVQQKEVEQMGPLLKRIRGETRCAIFVIEHDMNLLFGISDRVYALDFGRVIAEGAPGEIAHDEKVLESYLGRTKRQTRASA